MASNLLSTYSPSDVTVVLSQGAVSHVVSGFAEGTFVTIERNSETFEMYTGADNTNTRIYKPNESCMVTVSLAQTSNSNDVLSALYLNDKATRNSSGLFAMTVKDNSGRSLFSASQAYIAVVPNAEFSDSMSTRDWVIHCPRPDYYLGGNAALDSADQSTIGGIAAQGFVSNILG